MIPRSLVALLVALISVPALADRVAPGSCGALGLEVLPAPALDFGGVSVPQSNTFIVRMTWSDAPDLDAWDDGVWDEGMYDPWAQEPGGEWNYRPFSLWDNRSTTYDWYVFGDRDPPGLWNFRVRAVGSFVEGPYSNASAYLPGLLGAPTGGKATKESDGVHLSWQAPDPRVDENDEPIPLEGFTVIRRNSDLEVMAEHTVTGDTFVDPDGGENDSWHVMANDVYGSGTPTMLFVGSTDPDDVVLESVFGCNGTGGGSWAVMLLSIVLLATRRRLLG